MAHCAGLRCVTLADFLVEFRALFGWSRTAKHYRAQFAMENLHHAPQFGGKQGQAPSKQ
jgi:hypothetical protein